MELANAIKEFGEIFVFMGGALVIGCIIGFVVLSFYFGVKCVIDDRKKR